MIDKRERFDNYISNVKSKNPNNPNPEDIFRPRAVMDMNGNKAYIEPESRRQSGQLINANGHVIVYTGGGDSINLTEHQNPTEPIPMERIDFRKKGALEKITKYISRQSF